MRTLRILPLLGAVLLEAGCGLPDTYLLYPPGVVTLAQPGNNSFTFSNPIHDLNHDINVNFKGNELYYKIYGNNAVELNAYDVNSPTDPSVQLTNKGFYPVTLSTDSVGTRTDPVIVVDSTLAALGSQVTVTINKDISSTGFSNFKLATNPEIEIRRSVPYQSQPTIYKVFQQNLLATAQPDPSYQSTPSVDPDFASAYATLVATPATVIYIAWYAMSFGYTTAGTPVRSTAVYLGYMSIPYP